MQDNIQKEIGKKSSSSEVQSLQLENETLKKSLKQTEEQLVQAVKLATLGQLTATISHDSNNFMNLISNSETELRDNLADLKSFLIDLTDNDPEATEIAAHLKDSFKNIKHLLNNIQAGVKMIVDLNSSLNSYNRFDPKPFEKIEFVDIIRNSITILNAKLKSYTVGRRFSKLPKLTCHPSHLIQIFVNLLSNAGDALIDKEDKFKKAKKEFNGTILVKANESIINGKVGILVTVEDNGEGIPEDLRTKVTDTFYTTKPPGQGTGLGLSICKKVIGDHKGNMKIGISEELGGAKFEIWLPIQQD